jgi:hypothetical protein
MYQKAGRPDKAGKPKFKGGIADQIRRLAKKNRKIKCPVCKGKKGGCSHCGGKGYHKSGE